MTHPAAAAQAVHDAWELLRSVRGTTHLPALSAMQSVMAVPRPRQGIPEDTEDKVVELYEAGATVAQIQRDTELPRSSVYWVLEKRDIPLRETRARHRRGGPSMAAAAAVDELKDGQAEILGALNANTAVLIRALAEMQSAVMSLANRIDRLLDRME